MLSEEATNTNFIVFRFIWSGLEPKIYHIRGVHTNYYTTNAVRQVLLISHFDYMKLWDVKSCNVFVDFWRLLFSIVISLVFFIFLCITCCKKIRRNSDPVLDNYTENMIMYLTARSTKYDSLLLHTHTVNTIESRSTWVS